MPWYLWLLLLLLPLQQLAHFLQRNMTRKPATMFKDKVVLITGGSKGLGPALGKAFVQSGGKVCLVARQQEGLQLAKEQILAELGRACSPEQIHLIPGDVTNAQQMVEVVRECRQHFDQPVDVLVPCAGQAVLGLAEEMDLDIYRRSMELNYFGTLHAVKAVLPDMIRNRNGRIVLVSSGMSLTGYFGNAAYGPTKWAVRGLAETLRNELLPHNISVHHVMPPNMDTPGFAVEEQTKPAVSRRIEGTSVALLTADQTASSVMLGIRDGEFNIACGDFGLELLLKGSGGMAPRANLVLDSLAGAVVPIIGKFVRSEWDDAALQGTEAAEAFLAKMKKNTAKQD